MKNQEFNIEGMTCHHCVLSVKNELSKLPSVKIEDVQIGKAIVQYDETKLSPLDFIFAIEEAGYKFIS